MANPLKMLGLADLIEDLTDVKNSADQIYGDSLEELGQRIMKEAKVNAPVDTGFLRASGEVDRVRMSEIVLRFGADYAEAVHSDHPTQDKYLQEPYEDLTGSGKINSILSERVLEALTG